MAISVLTSKIKAGVGIAVLILFVICGFVIKYQADKITELTAQALTYEITLEKERAFYEDERKLSKDVIEKQNDLVDTYMINTGLYVDRIITKEKALTEARLEQQQVLDKELNTDSSSDNQLRIVIKLMKDFSNEAN